MADYINSALYATSPDAMADMEMGLPTREMRGEEVFQQIKYLMEDGNSQVLGRDQALQLAVWALKIAGESDLKHSVLAELVELPENYG